MSDRSSLPGLRAVPRLSGEGQAIEYVMLRRPLARVLAFTKRTIDDVVNSPLAKREVLGFYKLHRQVERRGEIVDLEKQWNTP